MLFPDDALFEYVLIDFAEEVLARPIPPAVPLPCDRWLARSVLQKAIRRGEAVLAQRSLANLFEHDRRATWRHLAIIALEDVGVGNIDILARIVAAQRDRTWRRTAGGDWAVVAELVRQMADSNHCQAACDLLLRGTNDPSLQTLRETMLDADMGDLIKWLADTDLPLIQRGIVALAAGGGLADGQIHADPAVVFDVLAEAGSFSHVVATCRTAWRISRNPMALLLPLIWQAWLERDVDVIVDDRMPPVQFVAGVPGYALDQFTRRGNAVSRALLADAPELVGHLDAAGVRSGERVSTIGDLIFMLEGGLLRRRLLSQAGDGLRCPHRWLPAVPRLRLHLPQLLSLVDAKSSLIAKLRRRQLTIVSG